MTGHSVRAILDGKKTQTRRIVSKNIGPLHGDPVQFMEPHDLAFWSSDPEKSPHVMVSVPFHVGDRLWVKEAWRTGRALDDVRPIDLPTRCEPLNVPIYYAHDGEDRDGHRIDNFGGGWGRKRSSMFMPRWASRLTLEVVEVGVERVNAISERDCCAEGMGSPITRDCKRPKFAKLWDEINGKRAPWASNPWVWALTFKRLSGAGEAGR